MNKYFIAMALALVLTASVAQAAVFSFGSQPDGSVPSSFDMTDDGITATFDNFSGVYNGGLVDDYDFNKPVGSTITFTAPAPVVLDSVSYETWGWTPLSGTAWLGSISLAFTDFSALLGQTWDKIEINGNLAITEIVAHATPLPAAALLLGTGLVGLVGLRRKFRK